MYRCVRNIFTHLYTSLHIFTHLCTSLHIFTHLYTSLHIFTHITCSVKMCKDVQRCVKNFFLELLQKIFKHETLHAQSCIRWKNGINRDIFEGDIPKNVTLSVIFRKCYTFLTEITERVRFLGYLFQICGTSLHIFTYIYTSLHIFTHLYTSLHIFTHLYRTC